MNFYKILMKQEKFQKKKKNIFFDEQKWILRKIIILINIDLIYNN
jgi:hypothetical protein